MRYTKSIFVFHRSLRLDDNLGLIGALKCSDHVIPVFIFTPEQTQPNPYRSVNALAFMIGALEDLDRALQSHGSRLYVFYGKPHHVVDQLLANDPLIGSVHINTDYTAYAMQREKKLQAIAIKHARVFYSTEDCLLHGIGTVRTGAGGCFKVFTPYYNHVVKLPVATPSKNRRTNYLDTRIQGTMTIEQIRDSLDIPASMTPEQFPPTRANAMKRLAGLKQHREYADTRNTMHLPTTRLSPYIKFGLVSVREVYHRIKKLFGVSHDIIRQLYWREFYYDLAWDRPDIFDGNAIKPQYDAIRWKRNAKQLERWKQGLTGCPVVDAGMRELNQTGYMHNRARLITSNYLTKHYFIDWHEGEKYYASKLIDYDPCVNNGNWQFTSGSGADSQPYFRMMNPWLQGARHDADCLYIKKWIPELANVPCEIVHRWQDEWAKYPEVNYPRPYKVYDYAKLKKESKAVYARAFE